MDRQNKWKLSLTKLSQDWIVSRFKYMKSDHANIQRNSMWVADDNFNNICYLLVICWTLTFNNNTCMYGPLIIRSWTELIERITFNYSIKILYQNLKFKNIFVMLARCPKFNWTLIVLIILFSSFCKIFSQKWQWIELILKDMKTNKIQNEILNWNLCYNKYDSKQINFSSN